MSKSAIVLLITWVVIGLVLAFGGGYYYGKKTTEKKMQEGINKEGTFVKPGEGQPSPTDTGGNKTTEGSPSTPSTSPGQIQPTSMDQPGNVVK